MQGILETVLTEARRREARRVTTIRIRVGSRAGVAPEALQVAFEALSAETLAAGGRLVVEETATVYGCRDCGQVYDPRRTDFKCPACHGERIHMRGGRELEIVSFDVAKAPA